MQRKVIFFIPSLLRVAGDEIDDEVVTVVGQVVWECSGDKKKILGL